MRWFLMIPLATIALLAALADHASAQYPYVAPRMTSPTYNAPYAIPATSLPTYARSTSGGYSHYGFPGNYYYPTYQTYGAYAPNVGATPAGLGMPVLSITYPNADGTSTSYVQASMGDADGLRNYYNAGYRGYSAPSPYYNYNQSGIPASSPSLPSYGGSTMTNTGNYGHYVIPGAPIPPLTAGTMGFGVTP